MKPHDSNDIGTIEDVALHRLNIAIEDLDDAEILFGARKFRGANNRAYYSIFHAIDAVLAKEGKAFKRHKDVLAYFNKNYIATEIFSRELGKRIVKAEEIRDNSDYDPFYIASEQITANQIETARELIKEVKRFLFSS